MQVGGYADLGGVIPALVSCRERGRGDIGRGSRIRTCDLKYPNLVALVSAGVFAPDYT